MPERLERARAHGVDVLDLEAFGDKTEEIVEAIRGLTNGRGPDAVIDAVGMEAHGSPATKAAQQMTTLMPDRLAEKLRLRAGADRLAALQLASSWCGAAARSRSAVCTAG